MLARKCLKQRLNLAGLSVVQRFHQQRCLHQRFHFQQGASPHKNNSRRTFATRVIDFSFLEEGSDVEHLCGKDSQIDPYWIEQLKLVDRPTAKALIPQLLSSNALGFELQGPKRQMKEKEKLTLFGFVLSEKEKHPNKIILVRCGEFYETYGVDAVMMVAYAGLNPMGNRCKAGCPVRNIQATLDNLTEVGLTVAVYEEVSDVVKGKIKERALTQIVSPCSRTYCYNLSLRDDEVEYRINRPFIGIMENIGQSGYTLCELSVDERRMTVNERLTLEGVKSLLDTTGFAEPLYFQGSAEVVRSLMQQYGGQLTSSSFPPFPPSSVAATDTVVPSGHMLIVERITGQSTHNGFINEMLHRAGRLLETDISQIHIQSREYRNRPRPIYTSTALQIGLSKNKNVPDLIPSLLPRGFDQFSSSFLSRWIQQPPPHYIANHMQILNKHLLSLHSPLPPFRPVAVGKVVSFLTAKEVNVSLFRDIHQNIHSLQLMLQAGTDISHPLHLLIDPLLALTTFESNIHADSTLLLNGCSRVLENIEKVVALGTATGSGTDVDVTQQDIPFRDATGIIPDDFFNINEETFRGRIALTNPIIQSVYIEIEKAAVELCEAVKLDFFSGYNKDVVLVHDRANNAVYVKKVALRSSNSSGGGGRNGKTSPSVKGTTVTAAAVDVVKEEEWEEGTVVVKETSVADDNTKMTTTPNNSNSSTDINPPSRAKLIPFRDRKYKILPERYTTERVRETLARYVSLTEAAPSHVGALLKSLCVTIKETDLLTIQQATHWAVILRAAHLHTIAARQRNWCLPTLVDFPSPDDGGSGSSSSATRTSDTNTTGGDFDRSQNHNHSDQYSNSQPQPQAPQPQQQPQPPSLNITGLSPYWMNRSQETTLNDVNLHGIFLLTAPNMSGKSTLMRSLLVTTLLANCGLYVPCTTAIVPRYDNYFLRTASYDVPSEGKSAFALEIEDLRVLLRDCTERSFVMIDEFGKGTSSSDGSSLAGALLEHIDSRCVSGVFATHLHELFQLPLQLNTVRNKRMAVEGEGDNIKWTYRLEDGQCTDSMAFQTARQYGIEAAIIQRALELRGKFDTHCRGGGASDSDVNGTEGTLPSTTNSNISSNNNSNSNSNSTVSDTTDCTIQHITQLLSTTTGITLTPVIIQPGWEAPAALEGRSCVYVLLIQRPKGKGPSDVLLYVGETESIKQRLRQHRQWYAKEHRGNTVTCLAVPVVSKSRARSLEPVLIQSLRGKGYHLDRTSDAAHTLFGGANN